MRLLLYEYRIIGINAVLILLSVALAIVLLSVIGGDLLNLSYLGYEVIAPFVAAIAVCEWGRTRADANFDIVSSQSKSLFTWVLTRTVVAFCMTSFFILASMIAVSFIRSELPLWELVLLYIPPALFLSSLGSLLGICFVQEHISTMICGTIWIISMLARSLLRFPLVEYGYLFIRFAGDLNNIWVFNKMILFGISIALWLLIYLVCKRKQ